MSNSNPIRPQAAVLDKLRTTCVADQGQAAASVGRLLDEYLADLKAGRAPDRAGFLAEHPELASQLADGLAALEFLHGRNQAGGAMPSQVGDFRILRELGHGGMGVVYLAEQVSLKRPVALKMIRTAGQVSAEQLAAFEAEAEVVAQFKDPHIVQIYQRGMHEGQPFFALEYVEGGSLARRVNGVPLPSAEAARLVETLAQAMHYAHQRGVVHRDLKPHNILLTADGHPKVADFGLAKHLTTESGGFWNTLGAAYYRAENWQAAVAALETSIRLDLGDPRLARPAREGTAYDYYFLALASWKLGAEEPAIAWFEKAMAWRKKYGDHSPELRHFHSETAELLGWPD